MCTPPLHRINKKLNNDYQVSSFFVVTFVNDGIGTNWMCTNFGQMKVSPLMCTVMELFLIMINLLSGDSIIHPWLREKYTVRQKLQKSLVFQKMR